MLDSARAPAIPTGACRSSLGDMVDDLPDGPFDVVLVAYNSLFNLEDAERQAACFAAVAARLAPDGVFVVEAFVPEDPPRAGSVVAVRSMTDGRGRAVDLRARSRRSSAPHGHFVQFADGERVRLRPWAIRYAPPAELDAMAAAAGLRLRERVGGLRPAPVRRRQPAARQRVHPTGQAQ